MSDVEAKRAFVASLYSGERWKRQVRKMSDAQVVAIYMREHNKPQRNKPKQKKESNSDDIPF